MLDAVLAVSRAIRDVSVLAAVAHGEGAVVLMGVLSANVRQAAYKERHVPELESEELESFVAHLEYAILVAPHVLPAKSYLPLLREYVPEIAFIVPPETVQVLVVLPEKDPLTKVCINITESIEGVISEHVTFPKTSWKGFPPSPLVSYQLRSATLKKADKVQLGDDTPPTITVEGWTNNPAITKELVRVGFTGRAYGGQSSTDMSLVLEGSLARTENQHEVQNLVKQRKVFQVHFHQTPKAGRWNLALGSLQGPRIFHKETGRLKAKPTEIMRWLLQFG